MFFYLSLFFFLYIFWEWFRLEIWIEIVGVIILSFGKFEMNYIYVYFFFKNLDKKDIVFIKDIYCKLNN